MKYKTAMRNHRASQSKYALHMSVILTFFKNLVHFLQLTFMKKRRGNSLPFKMKKKIHCRKQKEGKEKSVSANWALASVQISALPDSVISCTCLPKIFRRCRIFLSHALWKMRVAISIFHYIVILEINIQLNLYYRNHFDDNRDTGLELWKVTENG